MTLSCISSETKRHIGRNSWCFHTPCIRRPRYGSQWEYCLPVWYGKLEWWGYLVVNKFWWYVQRYRLNTGVWRTDGQTSCDCIVRAMHTRRTVKTAGGRMPLPPVYLCNGLASPAVCTVKFVTSLVTWQHHRCDVDSNSLSHPVLTVQFLPNCNKFVCWWYCDYLPKFHRSQFCTIRAKRNIPMLARDIGTMWQARG